MTSPITLPTNWLRRAGWAKQPTRPLTPNRGGTVTLLCNIDPAIEIDGTTSDVNGDMMVNITDALIIATCLSGQANPFCPDLGTEVPWTGVPGMGGGGD